jgi:predicted transglutaminase-like cysteine proteinase
MKTYVLLTAVTAALATSCLSPSASAPLVPYREPHGNPRDFRGLPNAAQQQHLSSATFPRLRDDEKKLLRHINTQVNRDLTYLSDWQNYGLVDYAVTEPPLRRPRLVRLPPARYADCEDFALTKKHRLARAGFSASRTFVATAKVPDRRGRTIHSVLAVPEGREWLILNNWGNGIERASSLERWWEWKFISPRYDTYLLSMQMRRIAEQGDDALPAAGAGVRARR